MNITRRDFLKWAAKSALVLGLSQTDILHLEKALAGTSSPPVLWLQGSGCSGCSIAALNVVTPSTVDDFLLNKVSVKYHPTLMAAGGQMAMEAMEQEANQYDGKFIMLVEGGIPTAQNGRYCVIGEKNGAPVTMLDAVTTLGPKARHVLAVGTCSSYKGVPGTGANITGITPLKDILYRMTRNPIINIPGCPAPPEIVFSVLISLITGENLLLDKENRPSKYYGTKIHSICPRKGTSKAKALGQSGCLLNLGCKGPGTVETCPNHKWNNGKNWCIGAGHHCIGCAMSTFPHTPLLNFGAYN